MGKFQSKHECFFVSADLNKSIEETVRADINKTIHESIWKKKSGYNVANYNVDETLSELSICLEEKPHVSPLRVDLPPENMMTDTSRMFKLSNLDDLTPQECHEKSGHTEGQAPRGSNTLKIEEFECGLQGSGIQLEGSEWSFTLYDFDGHGRITKEDLASLLKALYDAVGSSIKLPPNGAKTLKLRLSVGQDATSKIQTESNRKSAEVHCVTNQKSADRSRNMNKSQKSKVPEFSKLNNLTGTQLKCTNQNQGQGSHYLQQDLNTFVEEAGTLAAQVAEASDPLVANVVVPDSKQLASLVKENMERNQIKQLRRHHSDNRTDGHKHHKRRHRTIVSHCPVIPAVTVSGAACAAGHLEGSRLVELPEDCSREPEDRRNYYLDLAGVECSQSKFQNNCTVPVSGSGLVKTGNSHHRSRSQDTPTAKCDNQAVLNKPDIVAGGHLDKCDNLRRESERHGQKSANGKTDPHLKTKSSDLPEGQTSTAKVHWQLASSKTNKFRPVSLPGHVPTAVSPHYHRRHRHREKDHDLAMQQVAEWIEREHAWESDRLIVQRHEHHHFHEHHHHHHYHHYHEA